MAVFVINGVTVEVRAPLTIEDVQLLHIHNLEDGTVLLSRHGDPVQALRFPVETELLTTAEKDALETELLATGPATISGDVFGTAISAHVRPQRLIAGPLDDQWRWVFEVEGVGA